MIISLIIILSYHISHAQPKVVVLGVAQDAGYPQMGCNKSCCKTAWKDETKKRFVVSLALVDPVHKKWYLFEATPDIKDQLQLFAELTDHKFDFLPAGIFITHAHIGHYTGLMELGREVMGTTNVPVYALPKLKLYLEQNGPWSQLVNLNNISIHDLKAEEPVKLDDNISVTPFLVPHRDEYSETAGFRIDTSAKSYLFIPDIDKWAKFDKDIVAEVRLVDVAFLDATFYSADELSGRSIEEVPHPLVPETIRLFESFPIDVRSRVHFIHFNHTNPLLYDSEVQQLIRQKGFSIASQGSIY